MPNYLLLLYRSEAEAERPERKAEGPDWVAVTEGFREAGLLVSDARLHSVVTATTVRVRGAEIELMDGPFATTKEVLAGYYLLACEDLDEAVQQAARLPLARYGSVEVRAVVDVAAAAPDEAAGRT